MSAQKRASIIAMIEYLRLEAESERMGFTAYLLAIAQEDLCGSPPTKPGSSGLDPRSVERDAAMMQDLMDRCTQAKRQIC